jgi:hypothetical protein
MTVDEMRNHVETLCEYQGINITRCARIERARSVREFDEIWIAPIRSAISYAVALHEIGHILGRHQSSCKVLVRERWAWQWARQNAQMWTPAMEQHASKSMAWYDANATKIDKRWRPPEYEYE